MSAGSLTQPCLVEQLDLLLAEPVDVEGAARHEMLRGARCAWYGQANSPVQWTRAPSSPPAMISRTTSVCSGHGTFRGKSDTAWRRAGACLRPTPSTCGMTSPARWMRHRVADAHVEPRDLLGVVQRRVLHHDAADRHRLELGDRRQRAGAADLDFDVLDDGGRLLGRKFVRDRPARRARDEAEPLLPVEAVDLVDDAVDVVVEAGALRLDLAVEFQQRVDRAAHLGQRIGLEAAGLEPFDHAGLRVGRHVAHLAPGIGEEAERPRRRDRRRPSGATSRRRCCAD